MIRYGYGPKDMLCRMLMLHRLFLWIVGCSPLRIAESEVPGLVRKFIFCEKIFDSGGSFFPKLPETLRVSESMHDIKTGLPWWFAGSDMSSARQLQRWLKEVNQRRKQLDMLAGACQG